MRFLRLPQHIVLVWVIALTAATMTLVVSVQPVMAAGPADTQASELYRMINGERAFLGKAALRVDTYLASKARDGAIACPNNASLVMNGRARDFADYGYPSNSHLLRLCTQYTALDAMRLWGYNTWRGEVTAVNGGYGTAPHSYTYGCSPTVRTCAGAKVTASYTATRTMTNWISSSSHYAVLVGNYDRMGCGVWVGSNGAFFYDCLVSRGGRSGTAARAPTKPASPVVTPKPATTASAPSAAASSTPMVALVPQVIAPIVAPTVTPITNPTDMAQGIEGTAGQSSGATPAGPAAETSRDVSVAAGAATAAVSLGYGLFLTIRRRRSRKPVSD